MNSRKVTRIGMIVSTVAATLVTSFVAHAEAKRYLVEFKSTAAYQAVAQRVMSQRQVGPGVMAPMHLFNSDAVIGQTLDHLQMLVVSTDDQRAIQSLRAHPAIKLVEQEFFHPAPQPMATWSPGEQLLRKSKASEAMDRPWGIDAVKAPDAWSVTKGDGARVMVLDTGLDTGHPAVSPNFEKGQNFTEEGGPQDITDNVGHGTHVSGTILAAGKDGGLVGVAPEAKLLMGKVCEKDGCSSVAIAEGINWAVDEKADVVNMSLGGMFMSQGETEAVQKAEAAGVFIAAASGNDGRNIVSYPAAADTVMAVGAVDSNLVKADFSNWGPELDVMGPGVDVISSVPRGTGRAAAVKMNLDGKGLNTIKSLPMVGSPVASSDNNAVVYAGLGKPEDFQGIDVKGKIALISRGDIPFADKVNNAISNGAAAVLVYNNAAGLIQGAVTQDGTEVAIPVAMIEQSVGEAAKDALSKGQAIKATLEVQRTDYASFMGTSMATPHVAGVAALVRAANHSLTPAQVRDVLKSTATALSPNDQNQYGSGLVNAEAAVAKAKSMGFVGVQQAAN